MENLQNLKKKMRKDLRKEFDSRNSSKNSDIFWEKKSKSKKEEDS